MALFAIILLFLVVLEVREARPDVAAWIAVLSPFAWWAFRRAEEASADLPATRVATAVPEDGGLPWQRGTAFAVEGQRWNIYSRLEGNERVFWSGRIDWPGGDDWVEVLGRECKSLEEVLPDAWISFHPVSIAPELVDAFRTAYHRSVASLAPEAWKWHLETLGDLQWRRILGIPESEPCDS
jgi:hypothetical protein